MVLVGITGLYGGYAMLIDIEPLIRIDTYSHFFKATKFTPRVLGLLLKFSSRYTHNSFIQRQQGPKSPDPKTYAVKTKDDKEFRFHIGQLVPFLAFLQNEYISGDLISVHDHALYTPIPAKFKLQSNYTLYPYQQEASDFIVDSDVSDFHTRLVTIPTGGGKGVVSLATTARIGNKVLVVILAMYLEKWAIEISQKLTVDPKEIMIIQGSDQLKGILQACAENPDAAAKFTIVSLTTIQNFYKSYEEDRFSGEFAQFGCQPEELCERLGVGSIIIDETHQQLYNVFKVMCYSHVPKIIALSGTVISQDPFIEKIHKLMFPKEIRFDKIKMKKYIKVYPIGYEFKDFQGSRIKTTEHNSRNYSQTAYEKSMMKHASIMDNFMKLIKQLIYIGYEKDYQKGDKLAIYAGSIVMCTFITDVLKKMYPEKDVRRYVQDDPYENVIDADIRVTTILSAGTAIDIPQLTCVIMTNNVNSPVSNLQTLGRLREISDRETKFLYLYCSQIQKHVDYHRARMALFEDRVASIKEFKAPFAL